VLANGAKAIATVTYKCDTCGSDCTAARYHSLKVKDFELCPTCYLDGRFPSTMFSGDFVKLTAASSINAHGSASGDAWTDQELLLLLEAVDMFDDDWSAIEEHVGTRSAQQCIRKFLELPIEDPYLAAEGDMGPLRFARIPFEQADNPVMSVVAFLAGVVAPGVAAEAAKSALNELTSADDDGDKKIRPEGEADGSGEKGDSKDGNDNRMDEDAPARAVSKSSTPAPANAVVDSSVTGDSSNKSVRGVPHSKAVRAANLALKASARAAGELADAEEATVRSALAGVIKLTLSKLELKMAQFEELEDVLEEERRALEAERLALAGERAQIRRSLDTVRAELTKHQASGGGNTAGLMHAAGQAAAGVGASGQGTVVAPVQNGASVDGSTGPVPGGNVLALS